MGPRTGPRNGQAVYKDIGYETGGRVPDRSEATRALRFTSTAERKEEDGYLNLPFQLSVRPTCLSRTRQRH